MFQKVRERDFFFVGGVVVKHNMFPPLVQINILKAIITVQ
jgi:hypothetical protein